MPGQQIGIICGVWPHFYANASLAATDLPREAPPIARIEGAKVLCLLGDSVTTDHISPAGAIAADGPAGQFLLSKGVTKSSFNSFGSRRGNDRVMTRGTFGNIRIRNRLAPGTEGGYTTYLGPDAKAEAREGLSYDSEVDPRNGEVCFIYDAAVKYQKHGVPLVVLAGTDYGMGSSRDWAAKGTFLLGVKAVIATSFCNGAIGRCWPLVAASGTPHRVIGCSVIRCGARHGGRHWPSRRVAPAAAQRPGFLPRSLWAGGRRAADRHPHRGAPKAKSAGRWVEHDIINTQCGHRQIG